eukprot:1737996-Rhodomonas_salina.1
MYIRAKFFPDHGERCKAIAAAPLGAPDPESRGLERKVGCVLWVPSLKTESDCVAESQWEADIREASYARVLAEYFRDLFPAVAPAYWSQVLSGP